MRAYSGARARGATLELTERTVDRLLPFERQRRASASSAASPTTLNGVKGTETDCSAFAPTMVRSTCYLWQCALRVRPQTWLASTHLPTAHQRTCAFQRPARRDAGANACIRTLWVCSGQHQAPRSCLRPTKWARANQCSTGALLPSLTALSPRPDACRLPPMPLVELLCS